MGTPEGGAEGTVADGDGALALEPASCEALCEMPVESRLLQALSELLIDINARSFERLEARLEDLRRDLLGGRIDGLPLSPSAGLDVLLSAPRPPWAKLPLDMGDEVGALKVTPQTGMDESHTTSSRRMRTTELEDMARRDTAQEIALSKERKVEATQPPQLPAHRRFAGHSAFQGFFGFATIANAVLIGVQVDYAARHALPEDPVPFQAVTVVFSLLFMLELLCNLWCDRRAFFLSGKRAWSLLDLALVLSSLPELLIMMLGSLDSSMIANLGQARLLRILRVTRIIRLMRMSRFVRVVRALRTLVHQIASTLKSLVWGLLLLVLLMYGFGIMFTQTVNSLMTDGGAALSAEEAESARRFWSSLPRSMFTLYESVTGGISWNEVVAPFDAISVLLFAMYIAITQLAVLNVLTGVFCQNAIDSARRDHDIVTYTMMANKNHYVVQLQELFENLDTNGSGTITISELERHLQDERVKAYFDSLELEVSDAWALFKLVDEDQSNTVDINEFVEGCMRLRGHARQIDIHMLSTEQRRFQQRFDDSMKRVEAAIGKAIVLGRIQKQSWSTSEMVAWA